MDAENKSSQSSNHAGLGHNAMERGSRTVGCRNFAGSAERRKAKMTTEIELQEILPTGEGNMEPPTEEKIARLKRLLEEKLARSHMRARWAGMVEDCQVILNHLESRPQ
jgi:hypothetical protein